MITKQMPERSVSAIPQPIAEALLAGDIGHDVEAVVISAQKSPTKKEEKREFDAFYALTIKGMLLLSGGKVEPATPKPAEGKDERTAEQKRNGACDHFNYGRILSVRQIERTKLEDAIEGPEKSIIKVAKQMQDAGLADSLKDAVAEVVARKLKSGQLPEGYEFNYNLLN